MDEEKPHSLRSRLLIACAGLVVLLVLYVATFGPYCYVLARFNIGDSRADIIYEPVYWLKGRSPIFNDLVEPYGHWSIDLGLSHRIEAQEKEWRATQSPPP